MCVCVSMCVCVIGIDRPKKIFPMHHPKPVAQQFRQLATKEALF